LQLAELNVPLNCEKNGIGSHTTVTEQLPIVLQLCRSFILLTHYAKVAEKQSLEPPRAAVVIAHTEAARFWEAFATMMKEKSLISMHKRN
jgi:hypothetical protein